MDHHSLLLISDQASFKAAAKLTQLVVWDDPADRSYTWWRSDDTMESNLTYFDKPDCPVRGCNNVMVKYIIICVYQDRVLAGWRKVNSCRGKLLDVKDS